MPDPPAIFALSPARVHEHAHRYTGHKPCWVRLPYSGGIYSKEHYRVCSYCSCTHPCDLIELLAAGATLEPTDRPGKHMLVTPNPIAGELVRRGSLPGRVFPYGSDPADLVSKLLLAPRTGLTPTMAERLSEHFDRPCLETAPDFIRQPFYAEHATEAQWAMIEAMADTTR